MLHRQYQLKDIKRITFKNPVEIKTVCEKKPFAY